MDRRQLLSSLLRSALSVSAVGLWTGCRNHKYAHVLKPDQNDMVGTEAAGAETFTPLVDEAVAKLLGRHQAGFQTVSHVPGPMTICFVGVENKSAEELLDFREQIYQRIDTSIEQSHIYRPISRRFVDAALMETRMRPDQLFLPQNMRVFTAVLEREGQPVNALLYATLTSGTTNAGTDYQRDYVLTLEMVNVNTGDYDKESAILRKGYHETKIGKLRRYSWW